MLRCHANNYSGIPPSLDPCHILDGSHATKETLYFARYGIRLEELLKANGTLSTVCFPNLVNRCVLRAALAHYLGRTVKF
jgi:hypothetical protein